VRENCTHGSEGGEASAFPTPMGQASIGGLPRVSLRSTPGYPGERFVGYDNERGKGDHRHIEGREMRYRFVSVEQLVADFLTDVERVRRLQLQRKD
jgi:hypothetical protein